MGKSMFRVIVSVLVLLVGAQIVIAGEWVEYDLNSYNWNRFGVGDEGIGVAEANSNSLLFFNARTGVWLEHELATPMSVVTILADGFLVLVVGEDRAFAFNTINSSVHELTYVGSLLSTASTESQSYDCGPELAMVVTDQEFCVFDAELNQWQRHTYSLAESPNYMFRHDCHDFYAVSYMPLYNGDRVNVVYSLLQHEFNEVARGTQINSIPVDYGFAGYSNHLTDFYFLGYSAVTNTFSRVDVPLGAATGSSYHNFADSIGLKTAYTCYIHEYSAGEFQNFHNYGYDTRHGVWQYHLVTVPSTIHFGDWKAGGTFCSNWIHHMDDDSEDLLVFDGNSNSFYLQEQAFNPTSSLLGGNVMMRIDSEDVLGMAMDSQDESFNNSSYYGNFLPGMNHLSYISDGPGQDMKTLNCYNGNNNTWLSHTTGDITSDGLGTQHVQLHKSTEPQPEAIFYSAYRDEIYATDLDGWPAMTSPIITDHYAGVFRSSNGIAKIYDAHRGSLYSLSGFTSITGGERYFMTLNNTTHEAKAYSLATGIWSYQTLEADGVIQWGPDLIGIAKSTNGYVYNVYYAYDASDDSWSVLHPYGTYVALSVRERTALYLTNHFAYALGMGDVTGVPTNSLTLQAGNGTVEILWEGDLNLDSHKVRLTVKGPEITSPQSWEIPVIREGLCHFRAVDNNPYLGLGGLFTYTLEVSTGCDEWLIISTEKINLQPAQVASIKQIYPNPFNPCTTIGFNLTMPQRVVLCIYDIAGHKVRSLANELFEAGVHSMQWDGCDDDGRFMASGMYSVSLETDAAIHRKKVMLLR